MKNKTIGELIKALETALESAKGQKTSKQNSVPDIVKKAIDSAEILDYPLCLDDCIISVDTSDFGKIDIINLQSYYKPDKRKWDGYGDKLERISVKLIKDIPSDFEIDNLRQKLSYDRAKEKREEFAEELAELQKEVEDRKTYIMHMEEIMRTQKYE